MLNYIPSCLPVQLCVKPVQACFRSFGLPRDSPPEGQSMWMSASITYGCPNHVLLDFLVYVHALSWGLQEAHCISFMMVIMCCP